jgi:hypothetical protein
MCIEINTHSSSCLEYHRILIIIKRSRNKESYIGRLNQLCSCSLHDLIDKRYTASRNIVHDQSLRSNYNIYIYIYIYIYMYVCISTQEHDTICLFIYQELTPELFSLQNNIIKIRWQMVNVKCYSQS